VSVFERSLNLRISHHKHQVMFFGIPLRSRRRRRLQWKMVLCWLTVPCCRRCRRTVRLRCTVDA